MNRRLGRVVAGLTALVAGASVVPGVRAQTADEEHGLVRVPGAYFVTVEPGARRSAIRALVRGSGAKVKHEYRLAPDRIRVSDLGEAGAAALARAPGVAAVTPDYVARAFLAESVPLINGLQSQIAAAELAADGAGEVVCILDTGINPAHLVFGDPPAKVVAWADFVNGLASPYDDQGHGTHVAGIAAARTGLTLNGKPFQGVAPAARLAVGKVLDASGSGTFGDVQAGIDWCIAIGARTISLSLGGGLFSSACDGAADPTGTADHVNAAAAAGALVVSAAGNDRATKVSTPACASGSMAVGATYDANLGRVSFAGCTDRVTGADRICCFSNRGPLLDVVAPGCVITSAAHTGGSQVVGQCGTSQATPHVAGLAALLRQQDPAASVAALRARITATAVDLGAAGFDTTYGHGRIDVTAALANVAAAVCGDGVAAGAEACDGADLRGETCQGQGFDGGVLACAADCALDTSGCTVTSCAPVTKGRCNCDGNCSDKERKYVADGGVCADCQ